MRAELDEFWNDTLAAYKRIVEQPDPISRAPSNDIDQPQGEMR
jgi:hypothetical protein